MVFFSDDINYRNNYHLPTIGIADAIDLFKDINKIK